jgi:spore cortex biosynthesis protein YabQ
VTLNVQFLTLWMMFVSGLGLGVLFDLFRVLAGQLRIPKWTLPLTDLVYWIVATILVFRVLYLTNQGQVRLFVFIGLVIGILLYFTSFSPWIVKLILLIIKTIKALIRFIKKSIELLIIRPAIVLYRFFILFLGFLAALAIFLYKIVLQLLYPFWKLLLWLLRPVLRPLAKRLKVPSWLVETGLAFERLWKWIRRWF